MLLLIAAALVVVWALAFVVFKVTGVLIHLLLLSALGFGVVRLFRSRAPSPVDRS